MSLCVACLTLLQKEISAVATLSGIVATKRADSHNINKRKDLLGSKLHLVRTFQGKKNSSAPNNRMRPISILYRHPDILETKLCRLSIRSNHR